MICFRCFWNMFEHVLNILRMFFEPFLNIFMNILEHVYNILNIILQQFYKLGAITISRIWPKSMFPIGPATYSMGRVYIHIYIYIYIYLYGIPNTYIYIYICIYIYRIAVSIYWLGNTDVGNKSASLSCAITLFYEKSVFVFKLYFWLTHL